MTRKRIRFEAVLNNHLAGASRSTGYRYIKSGILPAPHKIGRFVYFFEDELQEALDAAAEKQAA